VNLKKNKIVSQFYVKMRIKMNSIPHESAQFL
jgi:hypothetical protein